MMRVLIDRTIVEYVNMSKQYRYNIFQDEKELLGKLDWDVLLLCVFLSLPEHCFPDNHEMEDYLEEMEFILDYCNVERESTTNDEERKKVKIKGYMLSNETEHVPCFYMLCLLIYCHLLTDELEKKRFLQCMIIAPIYGRIHRFSEENRKLIKEKYQLVQTYYNMAYDKLDAVEGRKMFDKFYLKYHMISAFSNSIRNEMDVLDIRNMAIRGFTLMEY